MSSTIESYKVFSEFYDAYVGQFNADFDFYKSFCGKDDTVLEIGCGTGCILKLLLQQKCKVTGIDISKEMLIKAERKFSKEIQNKQLILLNHDFADRQLQGDFDYALVTFYTFNYVLNKPVEFLKNIRHSLSENGVLLIDLFYPRTLFDTSIDGKWVEKEFNMNGQIIHLNDCRAVDNNIETRRQVFTINDMETIIETKRRYYNPENLKSILLEAGYGNVEFSYDYNYADFSDLISESELKDNFIVKAGKA